MPQFRPYWWINLISWILVVLTVLVWFNQTIHFPKLLRILVARMKILFS